jgi:peroxiredoxin Q/BCP
MTRIKQTVLLGITATAAIAAVAFAQTQAKIAASAPVVGALAPAYSLPDQNGVVRTSAENTGHVTLLAFYPADFTGGCTLEAHSLSASYKDLKALGVSVYGVSVQDAKSHKAFCTKEGIPYTLLADTQKKMALDYGVLIPGAGVANRVTYIIGADGKVAYVDKDVNSHLTTCGDDWAAWVKAHPAVENAFIERHYSGSRPNVPIASSANWHSESILTDSLDRNKAVSLVTATPGKPAPEFLLPDANTGKIDSLTNLGAGKKATVVMFLSTRCQFSNAYVERMKSLAQKYGPDGVAFVGIDADQNEPLAEVAAYAKAKAFPFPVLRATGNTVADAYNAHVTPETYVINSGGTLVYHGRIDNDMDPANVHVHDLANAIDETLAGKPVAKAETKAFGCSIKR